MIELNRTQHFVSKLYHPSNAQTPLGFEAPRSQINEVSFTESRKTQFSIAKMRKSNRERGEMKSPKSCKGD